MGKIPTDTKTNKLAQRVYSDEVVDRLFDLLPSNYFTTVDASKFGSHFRTLSEQLAIFYQSQFIVMDDNDTNTVFFKLLFRNYGNLLDFYEKEYGSVEYREFLISLIEFYFGGSTVQNIEAGVEFFSGFDTQVIEGFKFSKNLLADSFQSAFNIPPRLLTDSDASFTAPLILNDESGITYEEMRDRLILTNKDVFLFLVYLLIDTTVPLTTDPFTVVSDVETFLDVVKPAHTLRSVVAAFTEEDYQTVDEGRLWLLMRFQVREEWCRESDLILTPPEWYWCPLTVEQRGLSITTPIDLGTGIDPITLEVEQPIGTPLTEGVDYTVTGGGGTPLVISTTTLTGTVLLRYQDSDNKKEFLNNPDDGFWRKCPLIEDDLITFEGFPQIAVEENFSPLTDIDPLWICYTNCQQFCEASCEGPNCEAFCESASQTCYNCQAVCENVSQDICVFTSQAAPDCVIDCQNVTEYPGSACVAGCELACENGCQVQCMVACEVNTQVLDSGCAVVVQTPCVLVDQDITPLTCTVGCQDTCQAGCEDTCQVGCEANCQFLCETGCEESVCQTGCEVACLETCQTVFQCATACETVIQDPIDPVEPVVFEGRGLSSDSQYIYRVGDGGSAFRSSDKGTTWQAMSVPSAQDLNAVATDRNGLVVIVGKKGHVLRSDDFGSSWELFIVTSLFDFSDVAYSDGVWFICGTGGVIFRASASAMMWLAEDSTVSVDLNAIAVANPSGTSEWTVVGNAGTALKLVGSTWTPYTLTVTDDILDVAWHYQGASGSIFAAVVDSLAGEVVELDHAAGGEGAIAELSPGVKTIASSFEGQLTFVGTSSGISWMYVHGSGTKFEERWVQASGIGDLLPLPYPPGNALQQLDSSIEKLHFDVFTSAFYSTTLNTSDDLDFYRIVPSVYHEVSDRETSGINVNVGNVGTAIVNDFVPFDNEYIAVGFTVTNELLGTVWKSDHSVVPAKFDVLLSNNNPNLSRFNAVRYEPGLTSSLMVVGNNSEIHTSDDGGLSWERENFPVFPSLDRQPDFQDVIWYPDGSFWILVGSDGNIWTAPDAAPGSFVFTQRTSNIRTEFSSIALNEDTGTLVAVSKNGHISVSSDGIAWDTRQIVSGRDFVSVAHANGIDTNIDPVRKTWVIAAATDVVFVSEDDAVTWSEHPLSASGIDLTGFSVLAMDYGYEGGGVTDRPQGSSFGLLLHNPDFSAAVNVEGFNSLMVWSVYGDEWSLDSARQGALISVNTNATVRYNDDVDRGDWAVLGGSLFTACEEPTDRLFALTWEAK